MVVSRRTVMVTAAFVWYGGGIALFFKSGALVKQAYLLDSSSPWVVIVVVLGLIIGLIKTKFIFNHACKKNIVRIQSLETPRIWQCFRPGMLIFLAIIIPTGAMMSKMASGKFGWLCAVATIDLSIGTALLLSGLLFFKLKAFHDTMQA